MSTVRIKLQSVEINKLNEVIDRIRTIASGAGIPISGPIPLPTKVEKYVVNKAPFIDKDAREHFGLKTHKRVLDIVNPTNQTIDSLMHLDLPAGVSVEVKMG